MEVLKKELVAEFKGENGILTRSPVIAVENIPVPVQGKLVNQTSIAFLTYVLVFKTDARKSLFWLGMDQCNISLGGE